MEIFTSLERMEEILEEAKKVPFTEKCIIDKNELIEAIKEIRLNLPDELNKAKWIREERERIIAEAQKDADDIVKEAENRIISMIDEHEITKKAYAKKNEIIASANEMYREYNRNAANYADEILSSVEQNMATLSESLNNVQRSINEALETIKNNRKELK